MTLDEFLTMCRTKNWSELISTLSSNLKDLSLKITASAVIGAHHPDPDKAKQYGLRVCDGKLSDRPVAPMLSLYTSAVDLADFAKACMLAKAEKGLNDPKVANDIFAYVHANKMQLSKLLESSQVPEEYKQGATHIAKMLLARGANPDLADNKGQTLLNAVCTHSYLHKEDVTWIQPYVKQITNSLRYVSKESMFSKELLTELLKLSAGQTHGASILELTESCISSDNSYTIEKKLTVLFVHLSERNAQQMVHLLKNEEFQAKHPNFKQYSAHYLAKLQAIEESVLPASSKAKRLNTDGLSASVSSPGVNSIFVHKDSIPAKGNDKQTTFQP